MTDYLLYIAIRLLSWLSSVCNPHWRATLASIMSRVGIALVPDRFKVTCDNLKASLAHLSASDCELIARQSYQNFASCYLELLANERLTKKAKEVQFRFENLDIVETAIKEGHGVVLISAHFGNWELAVRSMAAHLKCPILLVAKKQRNVRVDALINEARESAYTRVVDMNQAARDIVSSLRAGTIVGMLIDQAADPHRDVFVDFLGRPAVTFEAPASLALRYGSPVVAAFAFREADGCYVVRCERIKTDDCAQDKQGMKTVIQRCSQALERVILQRPELWSWQHKRWKYNPKDYQH